MTLYRETPCEHKGAYDSNAHLIDGMTRHPLGDPIRFNLGGAKTFADWCPGGSREEVTIDYEAAKRESRKPTSGNYYADARAIVDAALVEPLGR